MTQKVRQTPSSHHCSHLIYWSTYCPGIITVGCVSFTKLLNQVLLNFKHSKVKLSHILTHCLRNPRGVHCSCRCSSCAPSFFGDSRQTDLITTPIDSVHTTRDARALIQLNRPRGTKPFSFRNRNRLFSSGAHRSSGVGGVRWLPVAG